MRRREGAEPSIGVDVPVTFLGKRWDVRCARAISDGERPQRSHLQMRSDIRIRAEHRRNLLAQDGVERGRIAGIRNEGHVDLCRALEHFKTELKAGPTLAVV